MTIREEGLARSRASQSSPQRPVVPVNATALAARKRERGVMFVVGTLDRGGTETQLVLLAEELAKRGWRVEVFSVSQGGVLAEPLGRAGIPVHYGAHRPNPPARLAAGVGRTVATGTKPTKRTSIKAMLVLMRSELRLWTHLARKRPSVVHAVLPLTNFLGAVAGRTAAAPLVITSRRGLGHHQERWHRAKVMDRVANRLSHLVIANSQAVARDTTARDGYPLDRIRVIPNGLDFSRFTGLESRRAGMRESLGLAAGETAIAMVANLIPYKGHRDLVAAFALAHAERPDLRLFLMGHDRGIAPILAEDARGLGIGTEVRIMGARDDVPALLAAMDLGVIASHEEGFCNALMEKLAAGLPVVATDVGGNPEALVGMPGCELVRPHDPADLARGLLAVARRLPEPAADRDLRRQTMRHRYSVEAMVDAYENLYLAGRASR